MHEDVGYYSAACGVVLQIVQRTVNLIEHTFLITVLNSQLIAVRLADRTRFVRPAVPNVTVEFVNIVALFLPYPKKLVHRRLKRRATERDCGKFFRKIVAVDYAELLDGMRRRSVRPMRTHVQRLVRNAAVYYIAHIPYKNFVSSAHS